MFFGFAVAFAFAVAAMLAGRIDSAWARWARPWTTAAWLFLTMGIARRASEAAFVWQYLYERATVPLEPLEHPRAPWVATRHEWAAEERHRPTALGREPFVSDVVSAAVARGLSVTGLELPDGRSLDIGTPESLARAEVEGWTGD